MSTSTRRERERANARSRLIAVASEILEREGVSALTVRRIAGEVEYTAPVVYQHFTGKGALLLALVEAGYERLHAQMASVAGRAVTVDDRVLDTGRAYVAFAGANPHLYQLMNDATVDADDRFRAAEPVTRLVLDLLTGWAAAHRVPMTDPMEIAEVAWGTMHGMASLGQIGTIGFPRAARLADQALRALLLAWRTDGEHGVRDRPAG
ncbi:TetR family transcriptional regulator [Sphaerisporangium melleum]|uniref:TetR family transcriptional regulator n=1 Tax=Sphaerisporangium melleum TaxID=321316 RepID=A0A917VFQ0_9ACTN|nr:TetR/AcrR family transcriptional regulator [Sphaerisporangium melleum]GGK71636.1 TetR family transcriptional regulator [Sphaerisporangium melleum]GII70147.1 TetR family transcriptional regulator [Sphaerisporangium melleum]